MVKRLLILLIPCFVAASLLTRMAWQQFDLDQARQTVQEFEQVLGVEDALLAETPVVTEPKLESSETVINRVIDGDTVELASGEKVRYIGIDTPETQHPTVGKECFGSEASARNKELVEGKVVRLESDRSTTDRYQRLLRYVWVGDEMINLRLIREGLAMAHAYPPDTKYQELFEAAELEARLANVGLWAACESENL